MFFETSVSIVSAVLAGITGMAVGFAWYSPMLFGNQWIKAMGIDKKSMKEMGKGMGPGYGLSFLASIVTAYVLGVLLELAGALSYTDALKVAFMAWLGFTATVQLTDVIFGSRKKEVFFLNTGYQLASYIVMAVVMMFLG